MRGWITFAFLAGLCLGADAEGERPIRTSIIRNDFPVNFTDDRLLVGASHDVFVGKVTREVGTIMHQNLHTRFEVSVIEPIKGKLQGRVFVDVLGGLKDGVLVKSADPGAELLNVGCTYTFATRSPEDNPRKIYRLNSHPNGRSLISDDAGLNQDELKKVVQKHPRVKVLKNAYSHEIVSPRFEKDARNRYVPPAG